MGPSMLLRSLSLLDLQARKGCLSRPACEHAWQLIVWRAEAAVVSPTALDLQAESAVHGSFLAAGRAGVAGM